MSELIKLVHGSSLDRSSTGVFYVTAGQRVSLPTRKANQKPPFEISNCCLLIEPSATSSRKSNDISVLLEWYWSSDSTYIGTSNYVDVATLYIPDQNDQTTAPQTQRLFNGRTFAASVEGGDSFHYWANSECWKGRVLKADDVVQPSDEPDLEQPSDEPDLAQPSDEPDLATSSRSIVEPNLQSARTRNLGVQTDGRTEVEDLRSQMEELRRELAAERKASDELRLQLSRTLSTTQHNSNTNTTTQHNSNTTTQHNRWTQHAQSFRDINIQHQQNRWTQHAQSFRDINIQHQHNRWTQHAQSFRDINIQHQQNKQQSFRTATQHANNTTRPVIPNSNTTIRTATEQAAGTATGNGAQKNC
ncbi:uncharacterized protein LOC134846795 [Symsagittifera roscoffensis]|uniref:uncharacterized protein LOC134846795 n=1 Tax=Symsagittifera roscoffensis TaxID=84072 RepID=UPI00307BDD3A